MYDRERVDLGVGLDPERVWNLEAGWRVKMM